MPLKLVHNSTAPASRHKHPRLKLTRAAIERVPHPAQGARVYRFVEPSGLLLVVGKNTKTFAYQSDAGGESRRVTLGRYPLGLTIDAARVRALELAGQVARGRTLAPNPHQTVQHALDSYLRDRKTLAPKTVAYSKKLFALYLKDWLDKPLASISPTMVVQRHAAIAKRITTHKRYEGNTYSGEATANDVMRKLRVVWNHARALDENLPPNPVARLSGTRSWFPNKRRTDHVPPDRLKDWWQAVLALPNRVHLAYLSVILFTGLRYGEAAALRWDEYDADAGTITLAPERNKSRRQFVLYLSPQAQDVIESMPRDGEFVFPADSASGHIEEPRWAVDWIAKQTGIEVTVHGLRRTFATVAESCPISPAQLAALMNHAAGSITMTYVMRDPSALRNAAKIVGERLQKLVLGEE